MTLISSGCTFLYSLRILRFMNSDGAIIFLYALLLKICQSNRRIDKCSGFIMNESFLRGDEYFILILSHVLWTPSEVLKISCDNSRSLLNMTSQLKRLRISQAAIAKLQILNNDRPPSIG